MTDIRVDRMDLGFFLTSRDQWWDIVWDGGFRGLIDQLPDQALADTTVFKVTIETITGKQSGY